MKKQSKNVGRQAKQEMIDGGMNAVAGLDLGDKHSVVTVMNLDGEIVERKKIATSVAAFERYFQAWARMRVVFEAGSHANWTYRLLERMEHEPLMADTHRLALITQSLSKDDRNDSERLAELGLRMPEMLNPVEPCSLETQRDRTVLRAREAMVDARTKLINVVRGTVKSFGMRLPKITSPSFAKKAGPLLPEELGEVLRPLMLLIQHATDEIRRYDQRIEEMAENKYPQTKRMRTANGVGVITSVAFVLNLDNDSSRLRHSRDAGARVGLKPKRRDSGERSPELGITKTGDPMMRRLLVQCAQYILGHRGKDSALRRWGLKLAARGGTKSAKRKAVVAVARKLAVLLHLLWHRDLDFDPFHGVDQVLEAPAPAA